MKQEGKIKHARQKSKELLSGQEKSKIRNRIFIILGIILLGTFLIYIPALKNTILYGWDDGIYTEDSFIRMLSWASISHFFSNYYLGMYQPLALLSMALNDGAGKSSVNYLHFTNILLHLINIVLAFYFIYLLTGNLNIATVVALLFGIHPMEVEAVAWIAARSTLLFTSFYLLALLFYLRSFKHKKYINLFLTFLFFLLSAFSKSMAVTFPMVLILLDYYKGRKIDRKLVLEKIPFFAVSIIFGIISIKAAENYSHITSLSADYNIIDRIFLLSYGLVFYIFKLIIPLKLSAIYAYPEKVNSFLPWEYYGSFILLVSFILLIIKAKKNRKDLIFGSMFFVLTISIVLPFYWSRIFIAAERYSYLTYIGLYFIIGVYLARLIEGKRLIIRKIKPYLLGLAGILFVFYAITTNRRTKVWKDTKLLLTNIIDQRSSGPTLSAAYFYRGNYHDMLDEFDSALTDYNRAIEINPNYVLAYNNRGIIKGVNKDYEAAIADFTKAIALKPDYPDPYYNRGLSYLQLQEMDKACSDWKKSASLGSSQAQKFIDQYCRNTYEQNQTP